VSIFTCTVFLSYICILGPPSPVSGIITTASGCLSTIVSWSSVISDPVCGPVLYDVTLSSSDGVVMIMRITYASYNFTGLTPDNSYTVTVTGRNNAGAGRSFSSIVSVEGNFIIQYICMKIQYREPLL